MDENIGRNFSPLNVSACFSTTKATIDKWVLQLDSACKIGLETILKSFLIVVGTWSPVEGKSVLLSENLHPSFQRFGCSATTTGAMDKQRPQADQRIE